MKIVMMTCVQGSEEEMGAVGNQRNENKEEQAERKCGAGVTQANYNKNKTRETFIQNWL